jgi:hypothetical protein
MAALNSNRHKVPIYPTGQTGTHSPLYCSNPVIVGGAAAFYLGFGFYGHSLTCGESKFLFLLISMAIIASIGVGAYNLRGSFWEERFE